MIALKKFLNSSDLVSNQIFYQNPGGVMVVRWPATLMGVSSNLQATSSFLHFWLPAACGGAALEANITVVLVVVLLLLMSFTQNLLLSLFSNTITQH